MFNNNRIYQRLLNALMTETAEPTNSSCSRLLITSILLSLALVCAIIVWAMLSSIEEVSVAPGMIQPVGNNQVVQHLEGGIVERILVNNGDKVATGQTLITLNPNAATADLEQLQSRIMALLLDLQRLRNFANEQLLNRDQALSYLTTNNVALATIHKNDELINNALTLLQNQHNARNNQYALLQQSSTHAETELAALDKQIVNREQKLKLLAQEKQMYEALDSSQAISKMSLMSAIKRYNETEAELLELMTEKQQLTNKLAELKQQYQTIKSQTQEKIVQEISQLNSKLLETTDFLRKAQDRVTRLTVVANEVGYVQGLNLDIGSVILPGQQILEIVPLNKQLIVDAKISTKDIGFVKVGNPVNIKVSTYHFASYGYLTGKISAISASTLLDSNGMPYYATTINLDKYYLGNDPNANTVSPGMIVTADIVTGKKPLLTYLLKPIYNSVSLAFNER